MISLKSKSEIEIMREAGFRVISSADTVGGGGYAYFDTDKVGGVQIELFETPPSVDSLWRSEDIH